MSKTLRFGNKSILFILTLAFVFAGSASFGDKSSERNQPPLEDTSPLTGTVINHYIKNTLKRNPREFNVSNQFRNLVPQANRFFDGPQESNQDVEVIKEVVQAFMQTSYSNPLITAKPGRGKSHLIPLLTMVFSYGAMPDHVKQMLQFDNPFMKKFYDQYVGKTQLIKVDSAILGLDPTLEGEAFPSQDERMKQIVQGLFKSAAEDFKKNKIRTIFVFDEIAILPSLVHETMKELLDKTGFKNPEDAFQREQDTGISAIGMTTPWEYDRMINGDGAVQRRWVRINWKDMNPDKAYEIAYMQVEDVIKGKLGDLDIDENAIKYIIKMNDFLYSPTQAMPDSILKALDSLYSWYIFNRSENGTKTKITLADTKLWFLKQTGRSDAWLEGPNGEPPFYNLEEKVLKKYKGDPRIAPDLIHQICMPLKAWARAGFENPPPVFILGGITASGKNTIVEALSQALYNNPGEHQRHSIGARTGVALEQLFSGQIGFGTYGGQLPLVVKRREDGSGPAIITLDEGADAENKIFTDIKVPVETGIVQSISLDSRPRVLMEPIFILGEWSGELFEGAVTDDEIFERYANLTQEQIDNAFLNPRYSEKGRGKIIRSLLQRAKNSGGVFIAPPTPKGSFRDIVNEKIESYIADQKQKNNLVIEVDDSVRQAIVSRTMASKEDSRGLGGNIIKFIHHVIFAEGPEQNMPYRDANLKLTSTASGVQITAVGPADKTAHVDFKNLFGSLIRCSTAMENLKR